MRMQSPLWAATIYGAGHGRGGQGAAPSLGWGHAIQARLAHQQEEEDEGEKEEGEEGEKEEGEER